MVIFCKFCLINVFFDGVLLICLGGRFSLCIFLGVIYKDKNMGNNYCKLVRCMNKGW